MVMVSACGDDPVFGDAGLGVFAAFGDEVACRVVGRHDFDHQGGARRVSVSATRIIGRRNENHVWFADFARTQTEAKRRHAHCSAHDFSKIQ